MLLLALAGCSQEEPAVAPERDGQGRYVIRMTGDLTFEPRVAQVPAGATVTWVNDSPVDHDVAGYRGDPVETEFAEFSSTDPPPDGWGRLVPQGGQFNRTFTEDQTWTLWCHTHHEERMKGVLRVG